jgi:hypothetical protein
MMRIRPARPGAARAAGPGLVILPTAYAPADWVNFGLATAGTTATLAGLLFLR